MFNRDILDTQFNFHHEHTDETMQQILAVHWRLALITANINHLRTFLLGVRLIACGPMPQDFPDDERLRIEEARSSLKTTSYQGLVLSSSLISSAYQCDPMKPYLTDGQLDIVEDQYKALKKSSFSIIRHSHLQNYFTSLNELCLRNEVFNEPEEIRSEEQLPRTNIEEDIIIQPN